MTELLDKLLDKISSYNLFNYLLPGVVFAVTASKLTHYSFLEKDVLLAAFLYYFIGLVISRIGSLVIEPLFKRSKFVHFADYKKFIAASEKDPKIELLSEVNNTYRTLCALFVSLLLLKAYEKLADHFPWFESHDSILLSILLLIMFAFAYRKQTKYVTKRIEATKA
jgi:hypothetical protein